MFFDLIILEGARPETQALSFFCSHKLCQADLKPIVTITTHNSNRLLACIYLCIYGHVLVSHMQYFSK
jgi:hypothetical protein